MNRRARNPQPKFPVDPLLPYARARWNWTAKGHNAGDTAKLAAAFNTDRTTAQRWRKVGLTAWHADQAAIAMGRHPAELWPEWVAVALQAAG